MRCLPYDENTTNAIRLDERFLNFINFLTSNLPPVVNLILARLNQCVWTRRPTGTVNQELKLLFSHIILSWLGW